MEKAVPTLAGPHVPAGKEMLIPFWGLADTGRPVLLTCWEDPHADEAAKAPAKASGNAARIGHLVRREGFSVASLVSLLGQRIGGFMRLPVLLL